MKDESGAIVSGESEREGSTRAKGKRVRSSSRYTGRECSGKVRRERSTCWIMAYWQAWHRPRPVCVPTARTGVTRRSGLMGRGLLHSTNTRYKMRKVSKLC